MGRSVVLREGEHGPVGRVDVVVGVVDRDQEVVRVVAAVEEQADERLVVRGEGIRREGADHPELGEGGEHPRRADGRAGPADEPAPGEVVGMFIVGWPRRARLRPGRGPSWARAWRWCPPGAP
jgi:hypothetical protein